MAFINLRLSQAQPDPSQKEEGSGDSSIYDLYLRNVAVTMPVIVDYVMFG